jgi:tetratricopeptide (TPR) repeat protein
MPNAREAHLRHARHYAQVLTSTTSGSHGFSAETGWEIFDEEGPNIQAGRAWAAASANGDRQAAELCVEYADAALHWLSIRPPRERILWLSPALTAARTLKDDRAEAAFLGSLGNAYFLLDQPDAAIDHFQKALAKYENLGILHAQAGVLLGIGDVYLDTEPGKAIAPYEKALRIYRETGDRHGEALSLSNRGYALLKRGHWRRATRLLELSLSILGTWAQSRSTGIALARLGEVYQNLGKLAEAAKRYGEALKILREIKDERLEGATLWNMSGCLYANGERARAIACAEQALVILEKLGNPNIQVVRRQVAEWRAMQ